MPVAYGDLAVGATSRYFAVGRAYCYAKVARVIGEPFVLQPIDFVGETTLAPGRYHYRLVEWPGKAASPSAKPSGSNSRRHLRGAARFPDRHRPTLRVGCGAIARA